MKNLAKLCVLGIFALFSFVWLINGLVSAPGYRVHAQARPTPPANGNTAPIANANAAGNTAAVNTNANTAAVNTMPAVNANTPGNTAAGNGSIPETFTLGQNSQHEEGEAPFNHRTHASGMYSPDGKSQIGCVECHHTDQPKSALKSPLVTSEREIALTMDTWKQSSQKVSTCRSCHFQEGLVPDGKTMPVLGGKDLNNEIAYHTNCNICHDAAAKARPELKSKAGFATTSDCLKCHKKNE